MRCIETRKHDGWTRRRYLHNDGSTSTTYEVGTPLVNLADLKALMRKSQAGRKNLLQGRPVTINVEPDRIDAVLDALEAGDTHATIAARFHISTRTIQMIKHGRRRP